MQTKKLIKAFDKLGFETKLGFNEVFVAFELNVFRENKPILSISDDGDTVDFLFGDNLEWVEPEEAVRIVKILYELVLMEE